jgi:5-methylcytosine-specific restriction protein A
MAQDRFIVEVDEAEIRRERAKARELRGSAWWKRRIAAGRCHYCGKAVAPRDLTMDHLVPLIRGGRSTKGNLVAACKACNTSKKHHLAFEWEPPSGADPA